MGNARGPALAAALAIFWQAAPYTLILLGACRVASGALPVVVAWLTKELLDQLASGVTAGGVLPVASGLAGATLVGTVLPRAAHYLRAESDRAVGLLSQDRLFAAVDRFAGLARFEDPAFLDRLRMAQQSGGQAPAQIAHGALDLLATILMAVGFVGSLMAVGPFMAVVVMLAAVPVLCAELSLSRRQVAMLWRLSPAQRREWFYASLLSTIPAAKELRLFGTGPFLRRRMLAERVGVNRESARADRHELTVHGGLALFAAALAGGGLLWAALAAQSGRIGLGDVSMFVAAVAGIQGAIGSATSTMTSAHQQLLMFDHFLTVTRAGPDLPSPPSPRPVPALRSGIELRDVWFRYSDQHPWALRGVSLFIAYGEATALVGRNGCGKSTLVKLLCRFYDPTRGQILWDGVDLRELSLPELRRRTGAVFQDFMQYDMTAAENIGLGDLTVIEHPSRIERAARLAGVHDPINALPHGYDTLLSRMFVSESDGEDTEAGVPLSGGQWQRVALARALLRDRPDLVILDEPTSGLDPMAEHEVHASLRAHRSGLTSLLISHRLGATRDADRIVVMSEGRIVEDGTYDELMALPGTYAELFRLQASQYQDTLQTVQYQEELQAGQCQDEPALLAEMGERAP
ncbi:ABC transporter ATP-binding protein [Nonomuraea sp. NPDC050404]|uniref:ABC transporter ATP-binding protein n=1 Tax=Nonomuraea sp. NPDC050404 TaxID=3155783 RepID=UPI0033E45482